jgi:dihydroorotate dehydrogenase
MELAKLIIGPAAGMVKTVWDFRGACEVPTITRVTVGSITLEPREGNIGQTTGYNSVTGAYANSLGLPNVGMQGYKRLLPAMRTHADSVGKELWASVAGFSPEEYATMTHGCFLGDVHGVELNFGCPNV